MTRIDKFHALAIGEQIRALAKITGTSVTCKYCVHIDKCYKDPDAPLKVCNCAEGRSLWWIGEYNNTDF